MNSNEIDTVIASIDMYVGEGFSTIKKKHIAQHTHDHLLKR